MLPYKDMILYWDDTLVWWYSDAMCLCLGGMLGYKVWRYYVCTWVEWYTMIGWYQGNVTWLYTHVLCVYAWIVPRCETQGYTRIWYMGMIYMCLNGMCVSCLGDDDALVWCYYAWMMRRSEYRRICAFTMGCHISHTGLKLSEWCMVILGLEYFRCYCYIYHGNC
jgi:hypothetical protein